MAVVIVATPGTSNANSYVTKAEYDIYKATRLHNSTVVDEASVDEVNRGLVTATRLLDEQIEWEEGFPANYDVQALLWPRVGCYDLLGDEVDDTVIPVKIKDACCELAIYQIDGDRMAELSQEGLAGLTAGSISLQFSTAAPKRRVVIPDAVFEMIMQWGSRRFQRSSIKLVRV